MGAAGGFPPNALSNLKDDGPGTSPRIDFAQSFIPPLTVADILNAAEQQTLMGAALAYPALPGSEELRQAIAAVEGASPEHVVVTVGAMHAVFLSVFTAAGFGGDVVTTTPWFPVTRAMLAGVGANVRTARLSFTTGYQLDVGALITMLTADTRLISLVSPHNLSGVSLPRDQIVAIAAAAERVCPKAVIIIDTIYAAATDRSPSQSGLHQISDQIVTCNSVSKRYGAPGLRIGWAITGNKALGAALAAGKFSTSNSTSVLDEYVATLLLRRSGHLLQASRLLVDTRLEYLQNWVEEQRGQLQWVRPDGGAICAVRLSPDRYSAAAATALFDALLDAGLRVARGSWFDDEEQVFRLGFATPGAADLTAGLTLISELLATTGSR